VLHRLQDCRAHGESRTVDAMMDRSLFMVLRALPLVLALVVVSWVTSAAAAPAPGSQPKRFRLHVDTEFFGFTHFDPAEGGSDTNVVGFGIGRPALVDSGSCPGAFCFLGVRPVWGLGFGYAFAQQRAVIGGRFGFAVDGAFNEDNDSGATSVGGVFVPYFRWIFLPGQTFRPYVEGRFGLGGGQFRTRDGDGDETLRVGVIYPTVGAGGGLHIFIVDAFSFDLGLNFDYVAPHNRIRERIFGDIVREEGWEHAFNVFNVAAIAGFSVWF
jgi:hypothetical protein